jgi:hypothetical protein
LFSSSDDDPSFLSSVRFFSEIICSKNTSSDVSKSSFCGEGLSLYTFGCTGIEVGEGWRIGRDARFAGGGGRGETGLGLGEDDGTERGVGEGAVGGDVAKGIGDGDGLGGLEGMEETDEETAATEETVETVAALCIGAKTMLEMEEGMEEGGAIEEDEGGGMRGTEEDGGGSCCCCGCC